MYLKDEFLRATLASMFVLLAATGLAAQDRERPRRPARPPMPEVVSPEVSKDHKVTFRVHAPNAERVTLVSSDMANIGFGLEMVQGEQDVWEVTVGPIDPGAYRYMFNIDGATVADARNTSISQALSTVWSLADVPGSEFADTQKVPHGAVAEVTYYSDSLDRFRRMHVYTPPGYENGEGRFPVLYLLHGATDSDDSWSTVGRAGFILDNLIAAGKARPMIVVMPMGHTGPFRFGGPPGENNLFRQMEEFADDFEKDLRPLVEKNYRVHTDRAHRAIAGLSMGGAQTLNIAAGNLGDYAYLGVFSSGVFGIAGGPFSPPGPSWVEQHQKALDDAELKKGLKLVWFATGKEDFLLDTTVKTVEMLEKHGFGVTYKETTGGHTWINWREYLYEFAPLLFQEGERSDGAKAAATTAAE